MNEAIATVVRTQSSNPASAVKRESETAKATEAVTGGLNLAPESAVSSKFDTLNLSNDYVKYKTKGENSSLQDQTSQRNSTVLQLFSPPGSKKQVLNYQLFAYTESELMDLFNQGDITMNEFEDELADRDLQLLIKRKKESEE